MKSANWVLEDWKAGFAHYRFWWRFGLLDIRLRYRRTVLGPFWLTMSFGVSAAALTFVYTTLFNMPTRSFFAYLISGLAVWGLIAGLVTDGCMTFIQQSHLVQQHRLPLLAHALRSVVVGFLVFLHNIVVVIGALIVFGVGIGWPTLLAVPAVGLVLVNGVWVAMLFGMLSARFRDLPQLVTVLVSVAFFVTPVFWYKDMLGGRGYITTFNPLYSFLEMVRAPLLGQLPPMLSVGIVLGITVAGWLTTFLYACRFQPKLTYWV